MKKKPSNGNVMGRKKVIDSDSFRNISTGDQGTIWSKQNLVSVITKSNVVFLLIGLVLLFYFLNPRFLTIQNLQFILKQSAILLVAAVGGTFIILMGSIDLSVGGVASLTCVAAAILANYHEASMFVAIIVIIECMAIGLAFGTINGFILVKGKIPSFLTTLGIGTIAGGIALLLTGGFTIPTFSIQFKWLATGNIVIIPFLGLLAVIIYLLGVFIANKTRFGKYVFAVGGGEEATRFSGVMVGKVKILTFMLAGSLYGLAGTLLAARIGAGSSQAGANLVLDVIAAVVMSGTSLTGGVGNVSRTILGVAIITVLGNGLNIVGVSPHVQVVIKGIIVIVAVFTTMDRKRATIVK